MLIKDRETPEATTSIIRFDTTKLNLAVHFLLKKKKVRQLAQSDFLELFGA